MKIVCKSRDVLEGEGVVFDDDGNHLISLSKNGEHIWGYHKENYRVLFIDCAEVVVRYMHTDKAACVRMPDGDSSFVHEDFVDYVVERDKAAEFKELYNGGIKAGELFHLGGKIGRVVPEWIHVEENVQDVEERLRKRML